MWTGRRTDNGVPVYEPPEGIRHAYADIAGLELADGQWTVTDHRPIFPPLTELANDIDVGYAGGDGQQVRPGEALPQPLRGVGDPAQHWRARRDRPVRGG